MQLRLITATGKRETLELAQEQLSAAALQAAVARRLALPQGGLRLVCGGQPLADDEAVSRLKDGGGCWDWSGVQDWAHHGSCLFV